MTAFFRFYMSISSQSILMRTFFLLIFFLGIGTLYAQNPNLNIQSSKSSIEVPANAVRELVKTENLITTLNFCELTIGENYTISIIPADEHTCYPNILLRQHQIAENQDHRIEFLATSACEKLELTNTCGPVNGTYFYVSILNISRKKETLSRSMGIMTDTGDPETLINDVFLNGDCVIVENISFQGNRDAIGKFSGGEAAIGIEEGLIITSGAVDLAMGPNISTSTTHPWGDRRGDVDLENTAGDAIMDAAVLEFDFTPTGDMVSFDFVFASEEYCDYVNASFNDAFGFYLTGPGHEGTNIAQVNGTDIQVSINSINHLRNSEYYIDNVPIGQHQSQSCYNHTPVYNPASALVEYDGFTVKLSATAMVEPCVSYHIKLAVGDAVDDFFDSAVFLGANSFDATSFVTMESTVDASSSFAIEGCHDAFLVFTKKNISIDETVEVNYIVSDNSSTIPNIDYEALPGSVTIPSGLNEVRVPIYITADDLVEGTETIEIEMTTSLCNGLCEQTQTAVVTIEDAPSIAVQLPNVSTCDESFVVLAPTVTEGSGDYSYLWNNGATEASLTVDLTENPITYSVIVTDNNTCAKDEASIEVAGGVSPEAFIDGDVFVCDVGPIIEIFEVHFTGGGPWSLQYTIDGLPQIPISNILQNPYELLATTLGTYELTSMTANNCQGTTRGTGTLKMTELSLNIDSQNVTCGGMNDGSATIHIEGGMQPYQVLWSNGATDTTLSNLSVGEYAVSITDANGCILESLVEIEGTRMLEATAMLSGEPNCDYSNGGSAALNVTGGISPYTFAWNNGTDAQNLENVSGGVYLVEVTDNMGCTTTTTIDIPTPNNQPEVIVANPSEINCFQTEISLDGTGSSQGTYLWTTNGGHIIRDETTLTPTVNQAGTYTLTISTPGGCIDTASVTVVENMESLIVTATETVTLNCTTASTNLEAFTDISNPIYQWYLDGQIIEGATEAILEASQKGRYEVEVIHPISHCSATAVSIVEQDDQQPSIHIEPASDLTCNSPSLILDASNSDNSSDYTYSWETSDGGHILSGENTLMPEVDAAGTYFLTITNNTNHCESMTSIRVEENVSIPDITPGTDYILTCGENSLTISASTSVAHAAYQWMTEDGISLDSETDSNMEVTTSGVYVVSVTDVTNGCSNTANIMVEQNADTPNIQIDSPSSLTCMTTSFNLDARASEQNENYTYAWVASQGGRILSGEHTLMPEVDASGIYTLTITNNINNCTSTDFVEVVENTSLPTALVTDVNPLDCTDSQVVLSGAGSESGTHISYLWTTPNGLIISDETTLTPTVGAAGEYVLKVTNHETGCSDTATVMVAQNDDVPHAVIAETGQLDCNNTTLNLDASASDNGANYTFQWGVTNGGMISPNSDTLRPTITAAGTYFLTVTDVTSHCESVTSITIENNTDIPDIISERDYTLTCSENSLTISATANINQPSYQWLGADGMPLAGETASEREVTTSGIYTLMVTDMDNGCSNTRDIVVHQDNQLPTVSIASPSPLTCSSTSQILDATASDQGEDYTYVWSVLEGGHILSNENSLMPEIDKPGIYSLEITNINNGCTATNEVEIIQDTNAPIAIINEADLFTCNTTSIILDANESSTGSEFTYLWTTNNGQISRGENTLEPVVNTPGVYSLEITNTANGCTTTNEIEVTQDADLPIAIINEADLFTCNTTSITLDAHSSSTGTEFTYLWTTDNGQITAGENTLDPEIATAGLYTLTVLNTNNNCSTSSSVTVELDYSTPTVIITPTTALTCGENSLILDGSNSDRGTDFTAIWTTNDGHIVSGEQTYMPTVDRAGTYTLEITNSATGCSDTRTIEVEADEDLPTVLIGTAAQLNCTNTQIELDAEGSDFGDIYSIYWSSDVGHFMEGEQTLHPTIDAPGNYTLSITNNSNGCTNVASILIEEDKTLPMINIEQTPKLNCTRTSLRLNATTDLTNGMMTWESINGHISSSANSLNPMVNSAGIYTLTITNPENNCSHTASVEVVEDMAEPIANAGTDFMLTCTRPETRLNATNSSMGTVFSYQWETDNGILLQGSESPQPMIGAGGLYTLTVTNTDNGCTAIDQVRVDDNSPNNIQYQIAHLNCFNSVGSLNVTNVMGGTAPFVYSVDGGQSFQATNKFRNLDPGTYNFVLQDANKCTFEDTFEVNPLVDLEVSLESFAKTKWGESIPLNTTINIPMDEIESIQWLPLDDNLTCTDCLNPTLKATETTTYSVSIVDKNGCEASASIDVFVDKEVPIYIPNAFSPNNDGYNDYFTIFAENHKIKNIISFHVFNRWGELVFKNQNFAPNHDEMGWDGTFHGKVISSGVFAYWTEIELQDGQIVVMKGNVAVVE